MEVLLKEPCSFIFLNGDDDAWSVRFTSELCVYHPPGSVLRR